jgi:hypothetical protein
LSRAVGTRFEPGVGGVATVLIITVPGGFEDFLHEYHAAGAQPDHVKDQVAAKYGITWARDSQA